MNIRINIFMSQSWLSNTRCWGGYIIELAKNLISLSVKQPPVESGAFQGTEVIAKL